jgi:hypothetical protein
LLDYGALRQLRDLLGVFVAAAIMAAAVLLAQPLIHAGPLVELILLTAIGALAYVAAGAAMRADQFRDAITLVMERFGTVVTARSTGAQK